MFATSSVACSSGVSGSDERIKTNDGLARRRNARSVPKSVSWEMMTRSFRCRPIQNLVVRCVAEPEVPYRDGLVAGGTQNLGHPRRHIGIDEKPHAVRVTGNSRSCTASAA